MSCLVTGNSKYHNFNNYAVNNIFVLRLVPPVEFLVKIQDVKAEEREDAVFECVISHPLKKINWTGKNVPLEQGDKYDIIVSEDMLIHTLVVKDCKLLDKGIYAAVTGQNCCNAWLIVEGTLYTFQIGSFQTVHHKFIRY